MSLITIDGFSVADFRGRLPVRRGVPRYPMRPRAGISMAVIHYSGVDADSSAAEIAEYQTTKSAGDLFPECAYSFVVRWDGRIEQCHDLEVRTWHAGGHNNDAGIGICLPGSDWPTEAQLLSVRALIWALNGALNRELRVVGHKDVSATLCPGSSWGEWKGRLMATEWGSGRVGEGEMNRASLPRAFSPTPPLTVTLGFRCVYDYLGAERCGVPLAPEEYDGQGNSSQRFSRCEMRWYKAENRVWVAFES